MVCRPDAGQDLRPLAQIPAYAGMTGAEFVVLTQVRISGPLAQIPAYAGMTGAEFVVLTQVRISAHPKASHLHSKAVQLRNREVGSETGRMMLGFFVFAA